MMGTKGSRWPEQEAERMSVGLSGEASSGKDPHPKSSLTPKKHHQLGTKSSNTRAHGGHFSFKPPHTVVRFKGAHRGQSWKRTHILTFCAMQTSAPFVYLDSRHT